MLKTKKKTVLLILLAIIVALIVVFLIAYKNFDGRSLDSRGTSITTTYPSQVITSPTAALVSSMPTLNYPGRIRVELQFINDGEDRTTVVENGVAFVKYFKFNSGLVQDSINRSILRRISEVQKLSEETYFPFYLEQLNNDNNYFWGTISSYPKEYSVDDHMLAPRVLVVVGYRDGESWVVAIEGEDANYNEILNKIPNNLLSEESRKNLLIPQ